VPWRGPSYAGEFPSLGWGVLDHIEATLRVPDGPLAGQPLRLTDEQAAILVRFYGLGERGGRTYRRAAVRRAKGWGKSPLLAAIAWAELTGPVVFDGWDAAGDPVGRPHGSPWVQIAAVSEDQTANTYAALYEMLRDSPALAGLGVDLGLTRITLQGRNGRIEPVTSSAGTREGQRTTFAVLDETHLWTRANGGRRLAATMRRNLAKMGGTSFESTNAHRPGESSVAEETYAAANSGAHGLLYDALEAPDVDLDDRDALVGALHVAYGDSVRWVDVDRIAAEFTDPATDPSDAKRFYLNWLVPEDAAAFDPRRWGELVSAEVVADQELVALGFDGSKSRDSTALVGVRLSDRHVFEVAVFERPPGSPPGWEVDDDAVDAEVARAFSTWRVARMYCDESYWRDYARRWAGLYGKLVVLGVPQHPLRMAPATSQFAQAIRSGLLSHDGSSTLARHVANCYRKPVNAKDPETGEPMWMLRKETPSSGRKIDAAVAAVLADMAGLDAIADGALSGEDLALPVMTVGGR
jgi:hypothetical protein